MTQKEKIYEHQRSWIGNLEIDNKGYVANLDDNLFLSLCEETIRDFETGDGRELNGKNGKPPSINAVHSSAALVCNFFEFWRFRDKKKLSKAMGFKTDIKTFVFEQKLSMGMSGNMPNLDVFMLLTDGQAVAIESKFTEWMSKKSKSVSFAESYFKNSIKRWAIVGLPNCQKLADEINNGTGSTKFIYLNASQLLKHALGLANMHSNRSTLCYLYYEADGEIGERHREEIKRFKDSIDGELNFMVLTYQEVFKKLTKWKANSEEKAYLKYLGERYFNS